MTSRQSAQLQASNTLAELTLELEGDLLRLHGPMVGGTALHAALGYPSASAFRMALARDLVPVAVFSIEHRRGKFALVKDLAAWLAQQRLGLPVLSVTPLHRSASQTT